MAIALVQTAAFGAGAASTTIPVSFVAPTGAARLLVCHCGGLDPAVVSSVTDDKAGGTNTWFKAIADPGPDTGSTEIWYTYNAGACQTVTVNYSASNGFRYADVSEWSSAGTAADPKDKTDSDRDTGSAGVAVTDPNVTPAVDGELIYIATRTNVGANGTPNSPFTLINQSGQADTSAYIIQSSAADIHGDFNNTGNGHWVVQIATFRPPSGGGTSSDTQTVADTPSWSTPQFLLTTAVTASE